MLECRQHCCRSRMRWFGERTKEKICPECREEFPETNFRCCRSLVNLTAKLRKLNLTVKEKQRKPRCEKHEEELKPFCENDKELICLVCRDSREHKEHRCLPVKELVQIYEDQRKSSLDSLTEKKSAYLEMELNQKLKISEVKEQASSLQTHITAEVTKMHQFLADKEQRFLRDLREEEERIVEPMVKNLR
ncbi:hypothetical protein chiPu_0021195 [Chiloscyllium punctatum]|uniref:B box-type domain-containing protein n=1 Tax=Chiloscyllium punctatum TaxID=137246 RepID=A0A401RP87_CHIPU|nr:hypothetical protein [Chiloscyllium punctatum]